MTVKKLEKLCAQIRSLKEKAGSVRSRELVVIAKKLGRYQIKASSHPQYGTDLRPGRITIPSHSKPLKRLTTLSILSELEADIFYWTEELSEEEK